MKDLYVHGIVKDYDKSINSINKYLFTENERLNAIIDDYEERIDKAMEYIKELDTENKQLREKLKFTNKIVQEYLKIENNCDELENKISKAINYIKENSYMVQDKEINGIPLMSQRLDTCSDLLEILGDKEDE